MIIYVVTVILFILPFTFMYSAAVRLEKGLYTFEFLIVLWSPYRDKIWLIDKITQTQYQDFFIRKERIVIETV